MNRWTEDFHVASIRFFYLTFKRFWKTSRPISWSSSRTHHRANDRMTSSVSIRLHRDFAYIMANLFVANNPQENTNNNPVAADEEKKRNLAQCLLILLSLALSSMRKLKVNFGRFCWTIRSNRNPCVFSAYTLTIGGLGTAAFDDSIGGWSDYSRSNSALCGKDQSSSFNERAWRMKEESNCWIFLEYDVARW